MATKVSVGIMSEKSVEMVLHGDYLLDGAVVTGAVSLTARGFGEPMLFTPVRPGTDTYAEVKDVTIGVNFHWQRKEDQRFVGDIKIIKHEGELVVINILDIEDYLTSVISSEMSATSSLELLKAHAVISRSWLLAQIRNKLSKEGRLLACDSTKEASDNAGWKPAHLDAAGWKPALLGEDPDTIIRWYDHDDHDLFDVCADDHCQRYQGITRANTPQVVEAIDATRGQVLMYGDELCDARFSKCCGGMMEEFETCWADEHKPYLIGIRDDAAEESIPDLRNEAAAEEWIMSAPEAFCNTDDARILRQVLNNYDQETADFYRWRVDYTHDYLSDLLLRRTGIDFGRVTDMIPIERGRSGRISRLKIVGTKTTKTIGKELEIRRALSESHLYSSAFVVDREGPLFTLHGAGWGHGVGLCQIGAAVMADKGYSFREILAHYYPGSKLTEIQ